ncbi:MAG: AAA family ATPase [Comamonadaceae bacterium]|nr:AAA family ATPase [Burkholderiales bacterium]MEB2347593.1 AAA family ATPase [Comamonadaceae bacterium]
MSTTEIERARAALQCISPDLGREQWARVGMACKAAGMDFADWDTWCQQGGTYSAADARDTWRSIKADGGIGAATLFYEARANGWRDDGKPQQASPSKAPIRAPEPPRPPRKGMGGAEVWARCEPATTQHPYCQRKGIDGAPIAGLRVVPEGDALSIAGKSVAGWLVVPAHGPAGELQSLQFIPPPGIGKKLNLPGASMAGASFTVGAHETDAPLYVCEGIGQAWACWQATGHAAICCFGWGNVATVARAIHERDSAARLVLVPDAGKESSAARIASEIGCAVATLPDGEPQNFDCNDFAAREGHDVLADLLERASEPPRPAPLLLLPVDVAGVISHPSPPPRFVWGPYLPRQQVAMLAAHGGTGKSTIALMLAVCVASGRELFGHTTEQGRVVFASLEDGADVVRHRLAFICQQWGIEPHTLAQHVAIVDGTSHPELFTAERREHGQTTASYAELRELAKGAALLVIDNASDAYAGDEIQRQQVRAFIRCLAEIARADDCAVLLLAHVDKVTSRARKADGGEGYSGSTAWNNSVRSRLFMSRAEDGTLSLEHQKSNLGPLAAPLALHWPHGGLPELDTPAAGVVAHIAERGDTTALLKLIAEFSERGEYIAPGTTSPSNAARLLAHESTYPKRKPREVFDLLRRAERAGHIERTSYRDAQRKTRERWDVTSKGRQFAGLAPTAPTARTTEDGADAAPVAPTAPTARGVIGGARAHKMAHCPPAGTANQEGETHD